MFGCPPHIWMPPYVCMPPVHTQQKESMLCHTKGCPYAPYVWTPPVCLDAPYVWMLPVCLDVPHVWTPPYAWMPPICLNTLLYVWVMFGCPPVHAQHIESMLFHTKEYMEADIHESVCMYECMHVYMFYACTYMHVGKCVCICMHIAQHK